MKVKISGGISGGSPAYRHDTTNRTKENIDQSLSKDNVTLIDELAENDCKDVRQYINKIMQPYIDEYNSKQRRKDRRIETDYVTYRNKDAKLAKELCYEYVFSMGEHETLGKEYYAAKDELTKKGLHDFWTDFYTQRLKEFQKEYPHMKVLWATIHFDEPQGTPHMHLAVTPFADNYKQKLPVGISVNRALEQDGIYYKKDFGVYGEGLQLKQMCVNFENNFMRPAIQQYAEERGYEMKEELHYTKKIRTENMPEEYPAEKEARERARQIISDAKERERELVYREEKVKDKEEELAMREDKVSYGEKRYEHFYMQGTTKTKDDFKKKKSLTGKTNFELTEEQLKELLDGQVTKDEVYATKNYNDAKNIVAMKNSIIDGANAEARSIKKEADEYYDNRISDANDEYDNIIQKAQEEVDDLDERIGVFGKVKKLMNELKDAMLRIARLERLEEYLEDDPELSNRLVLELFNQKEYERGYDEKGRPHEKDNGAR